MKKFFSLGIAALFLSSIFMVTLSAKSSSSSRGGSAGGFKSSSSSSRSSSSSSRSTYSSPSRSSYSQPSRPSYGNYGSPSGTYQSPSGNYGNRYSTPYQSSPGYSGGGTTIVPIYGGSPAAGTSSSGSSGAVFFIIILVIIGGVVYMVMKNRKKKASGEVDSDSSEVQLFFIQAGFYYGKGELEDNLVQTAKAVDTSDTGGLLTLLREVAMLIRRNTDGVRWFNFKKTTHSTEASAEAAFEKLVTDERMKIDTEEFTDQNGMEVDRRKSGPKLEEVIVINMAVACYCDVLLDDGITFENFEKTIGFFSAIPEDHLLGTNVVWNITDKDELIGKFPELRGV